MPVAPQERATGILVSDHGYIGVRPNWSDTIATGILPHNMAEIIAEHPPFTIRVSTKVRRISLQYSQERGLELVIPHPRYERKALEFLKTQREWVEKKYKKYKDLIPLEQQSLELPQVVYFAASAEEWRISYHPSPRSGSIVLAEASCVIIYADINDTSLCQRFLTDWLKQVAERFIARRLDELSELYQLPYHSLRFGSAKTMWGSCSREHRITLNYHMLFFPEEILDYVLIHELCHTKHFNHSKRFWALVERCEPNYRELRLKLREEARCFVPRWVYL